jgi:ankyrin repeat protein
LKNWPLIRSVFQVLLDRGAKLEFRDEHGQTALHCAAMKGHLITVKMLFDSGALLVAKTDSGDTALHLAALYQGSILQNYSDRKLLQ